MQQLQKQLDRLSGDQGCDLHSSCLECPLPHCRHDEELEDRMRRGPTTTTLRRAEQAANLRRQGFSVEEIGRRYNMSERNVFRLLQLAEQEGSDVSRRKNRSIRNRNG